MDSAKIFCVHENTTMDFAVQTFDFDHWQTGQQCGVGFERSIVQSLQNFDRDKVELRVSDLHLL